MHRQIRFVIEQLRFRDGKVLVVLTAGEQTALGSILHKVYYRSNICDVIDRQFHSGYPHNGGLHTFEFFGPKHEAIAMLELIKEDVTSRFILSEEESRVVHELSFVSQEILAKR